jgi:hypothetical protein
MSTGTVFPSVGHRHAAAPRPLIATEPDTGLDSVPRRCGPELPYLYFSGTIMQPLPVRLVPSSQVPVEAGPSGLQVASLPGRLGVNLTGLTAAPWPPASPSQPWDLALLALLASECRDQPSSPTGAVPKGHCHVQLEGSESPTRRAGRRPSGKPGGGLRASRRSLRRVRRRLSNQMSLRLRILPRLSCLPPPSVLLTRASAPRRPAVMPVGQGYCNISH